MACRFLFARLRRPCRHARVLVGALVVGQLPWNVGVAYAAPEWSAIGASTLTVLSNVVSSATTGGYDPPAPDAMAAPGGALAAAAATTVTVNRTRPRVTAPPSDPTFSAHPTDAEFFRARVFSDPLLPIGRATTAHENAAFAIALRSYLAADRADALEPLQTFLRTHPESPWRASLLVQLGEIYHRRGFDRRALEAWDAAWHLTQNATSPQARTVADRALAEWLRLAFARGEIDAVSRRLRETATRSMAGDIAARITPVREHLALMTHRPDVMVPAEQRALEQIALTLRPRASTPRGEEIVAPTRRSSAVSSGMSRVSRPRASKTPDRSLRAALQRASALGLRMRIVRRLPGTPWPTPALVHLKTGHAVALLSRHGDAYRMYDPLLGDERAVSATAFDEESSDYALVPRSVAAAGLVAAGTGAAAIVMTGLCPPGPPDDDDPPPCNCGAGAAGPGGGGPAGGEGGNSEPGSCGTGPCQIGGLATYRLHLLTAGLLVEDTPVGHRPPRGPGIFFHVRYNQRSSLFSGSVPFSNLGPNWTHDWLSYVQDWPLMCSTWGDCTPAHANVILRGGGRERYFLASGTAYHRHWRGRADLVRISESPLRFERRLRDGGVEVYGLSDGTPTGQVRRVFLTQITDPQGQTVQLTYDSQFRLVGITDALGQVTTLSYELASDPLKITKVTDPFGRFATFTYTSAGQLASITDVIGLASSFRYAGDGFLQTLTTPYGMTTFRKETDWQNSATVRSIEAVDPLGGIERAEYHTHAPAPLPEEDPENQVPTGFEDDNVRLHVFVSLYWDKRAMSIAPRDPASALVLSWNASNNFDRQWLAVNVPRYVKRPLEGRVWYSYSGQPGNGEPGTWIHPTRVGRVQDDGTSQIWATTYNDRGMVTSKIDPLGRRTTYGYAANGIDLLEVRQTTGTLNDLLATYSNYNARHLPQTTTDAAGQATTFTYNASGQVQTVTNAKNETTTYTYDSAGNGYLQSVTGPMVGATTSYSYDSHGRLRTTTDAEGDVVTTDYDLLDRPTRVSYPHGTHEESTYDKLDLVQTRDRLGRLTRRVYDPLRRLTSTRDPLGRTITQQWCGCGSLDALIDAKGQRTAWERDLQGRVTREIRADGITATVYAYEATTSRLKTMTDQKQQVSTYWYYRDDTLQQVTYTNAQIATPSVSYAYDSGYSRLTTMQDGTGTTSYTYHPPGVPGAGQNATVDGPLADDTIAYAHDQLGRVTSRTVKGVAVTYAYDALGRTTSESNVLGTFMFGYHGVTSRLATVSYPNGQTTEYGYFDHQGDHRLQTIHHRRPAGATLSRHDYTYDTVGNILTWQQQSDSDPAILWTYRYDAADQLVGGVKQTTDASPVVLQRYVYAYDMAGNRLVEQIGDAATTWTYDALNRVVTQRAGGPLLVVGSVNEPASVIVAGRPAVVDSTGRFTGSVPTATGTTSFVVAATDASGNVASTTYEVDQAGPPKSFTFDANGNLTGDGSRTFEWNVRNQLVSVTAGAARREFRYDGRHRRVNERTFVSGVLTEDVRFVMCGTDVCEERHASNVRRHVYEYGERFDGTGFFYTKDHLGSLTELVDSAHAVRARKRYDPFGRQEHVGDVTPRVGFSGHIYTPTGGLNLTYFRAYDPDMGRWISSDPLGWKAGPNFYAYVEGRPTTLIDPFGLQSVQCRLCNSTQADQARSAVSSVCRNVSGNKRCQQVLGQYQLLNCFKNKCNSSINVVCVPRDGACGGCGGPCNPVSDVTKNIFIQPTGFQDLCGSLSNTVAHEMAHMCGIGSDVGDEPARRDNRRKATDVGLACSGSQ